MDPPLLGFGCCICKSVKSSNGGWFAAALAHGKESMTFKKIGSDVAVDMNKKINTKVDVREGVAGEALHCYKCGKKEQVARRMKRTVDEALFSFDFNLGDTNSLVAHTPALHPVPLPASSVATLASSLATATSLAPAAVPAPVPPRQLLWSPAARPAPKRRQVVSDSAACRRPSRDCDAVPHFDLTKFKASVGSAIDAQLRRQLEDAVTSHNTLVSTVDTQSQTIKRLIDEMNRIKAEGCSSLRKLASFRPSAESIVDIANKVAEMMSRA